MKREKFLWPLTHGHQRGLMAAKNIKGRIEGLPPEKQEKGIGSLLSEVREFWGSELKPHFTAEERLLRVFSEHTGEGDPDIVRVLEDHRTLERMVRDGSREDLLGFSELLTAHIRFEEETLFARIEKGLTQSEILKEEALLKQAAPTCPKIPGAKDPD